MRPHRLTRSATVGLRRGAAHWLAMSTKQTIAHAEQLWRQRRDRPLAEAVTEALEDSGAVVARIDVGSRVMMPGVPGTWLVISLAPTERGRRRLHVQSEASGSLATVEARSCIQIGHFARTPDLTLF